MTSPQVLAAAAETVSWLLYDIRLQAGRLIARDAERATANRCRAALRVLRHAEVEALRACESLLADEPFAAAAVSLVAVDLAGSASERALSRVLGTADPVVLDSAIFGLRFATTPSLPDHTARVHPLADCVTRAFHRTASASQLASLATIAPAREEERCHLVLAAGRVGGSIAESLARAGCDDASSEVRRTSLRAAARLGCPWLLDLCRSRSARGSDPEATIMLGVIGDHQDAESLRECVASDCQRESAVVALGRLGRSEDIPLLIDLLNDPSLAEIAVHALRRVVGIEIPRGLPRDPPPDLSDEALDVWDTTGQVDTRSVRTWWQSARHRYEPGVRYQWDRPVSIDPLGATFDALPTCVRQDLYLRERLLHYGRTPDWELEGWP